MSISRIFIERPIGTALLAIGLMLAGAVAYVHLPVASMPAIEFPTIRINTSRPGADPATMAASVAAPLERRLRRNRRRHRDDLDELARLGLDQHAVRPEPQHRRRRARRASRPQRRRRRSPD